MDAKSRLFLAVDVPEIDAAQCFMKQFSQQVGAYKIGAELFLKAGPAISKFVVDLGVHLFLDLKLHDIPRTVEAGVKSLAKQGANWVTVHALGGSDMLKAALEGAACNSQTKVLAVTILTSHTQETLRELGMDDDVNQQVLRLAELASHAGVPGLVCSAQEAAMLRENLPEKTILVCPGIRMPSAFTHDQKRTASPRDAILAGADYLVVGRPILEASDQSLALKTIIDDMQAAFQPHSA